MKQGHIQTESEGLEKDSPCKQRPKESRVAVLISDKIVLKTKAVKRQRRTPHNDQRINSRRRYKIINIYAPNIGALQYVRQILMSMKEEINSNTIIVGDFNTPPTTMDRSTKQKINKETQTLNDTMDQLDLIDIYRTFHLKTISLFLKYTRKLLQNRSYPGP